jgi:hypothetical protein
MKRCGSKTEVYSRVVGYYRPVGQWNKGKQEEFKDRTCYDASIHGTEEKSTLLPQDAFASSAASSF